MYNFESEDSDAEELNLRCSQQKLKDEELNLRSSQQKLKDDIQRLGNKNNIISTAALRGDLDISYS